MVETKFNVNDIVYVCNYKNIGTHIRVMHGVIKEIKIDNKGHIIYNINNCLNIYYKDRTVISDKNIKRISFDVTEDCCFKSKEEIMNKLDRLIV